MMKCPRCEQETPSDADFCPECGAKLALVCSSCGTANSPTHKFCKKCGQGLASGASRVQAGAGAPSSYTPKHLAEKILTSKAALEGERKQVTVLFADLKGSMELLADRDPEYARKILDPVLERMMEAIHRYEGTVNQVMGDGIMALFGAPLACEDHAVRACYAALRMQETITRYAEGVRRAEGFPLQIRVGLNSGDVVVRTIGSDLRMDYTAVGQTTHVAARMEQMAVPGSILLSAATLALAEGYVEVKPLGPLPVRGLEAPLEVYELTRATTIRSRFQAAAARGLNRFVGREPELDYLRQALARVRAGHGQVVAVVGEPGVGKSRLYWEFSHSHRAQGWLILESGSVSYGKATSYLPIIELLRAYFAIEPADAPRKIREKVTGKLLSLDRQLESSVSPILWLLDVPVEDEPWERLDAPQRRQRILDGVKRLILRESQVQPLMVLFEDLHWIDAETQALLDSLVDGLPTARVLLLVNYRPEYGHGWGGKTYYRQLPIDPLPPESVDALLDALLGRDATLVPLKRLVIERTEGNPFFIEESVRTLVETAVLAGEHGAYRLTRAVQNLQVPATAQAMLAARIDRLAPEDKRLLQAAAVIGTDVPLALLQAVADEPEDRLRHGLAELQATEFLYETRLFPDLEYTFRHALTHEVAYQNLLLERRKALHARVVDAIERLYGDRLTEQAETLAHHALRGEAWEKAVAYVRQAGGKAMERSAYPEAADGFEAALEALRHLPESRERRAQAIDLHLDASAALIAMGGSARSTDHAREAQALAESLGDDRRLGWSLAYLANRAWFRGDPESALEMSERVLDIAVSHQDVGLEISANFCIGGLELTKGNYRKATERLRQVVEALQGDRLYERSGPSPLRSVFSRERLVWSLAELGDFAEALARGEEAVQIASEVEHHHSLVLGHRCLGLVALRRGDVSRAISSLERAVMECQDTQARSFFDVTAGHLGYAYALSGRLPEGVALLEEAIADPETTGTSNHPLLLTYLGEAHLLADRREEALTVARRALELALRQKERGNEAWVLRLLGEIASGDDRLDAETAEGYYRQALALATELGMRPLAAHCHRGLGTLYRRSGGPARAEAHLEIAASMYREVGMTYWLEKTKVETAAPADRTI